ncbi:uncharacterized protein LOC114877535 [Osmia bicornis bicornis]|uniref:uncharacterized protein LOC114877535 n=1 Tax=Osmia bicornis bicornis TaxID=1437191 RepID=UPI001EAEA5DB|nr:uncharacterized protein LOC114877535 [Osmia bicornis bicornis]
MVDAIKRAIAKDPSNWRKQLFNFLYSYRYTPCSATDNGKSPAEIFVGRRINSPFTKLFPRSQSDVLNPDHSRQLDMQSQFNQHHGARARQLSVGDRVVVLTQAKKTRAGGREIERHINHIWRGGDSDQEPTTSTSTEELAAGDDWTFFTNEPPNSQVGPDVNTPEIGIPEEEELTTPLAHSTPEKSTTPEIGIPKESTTPLAPARPVRLRTAPRRLELDPTAKSYAYW